MRRWKQMLREAADQFRSRGIRRRWMMNSVGAVFLIMVALVLMAVLILINYYYANMRNGLEIKAKLASDFFASYAANESEYMDMVRDYITEFDDKDSLELQFLTAGEEPSVYLSSYGLTSGSKPGTQDITAAVEEARISTWIGRDPSTGERILAVSAPIINGGEVKAVLRLVSSLRLVDGQLALLVCLLSLVGVLVVAMVYAANVYFVKSIIEPLGSITETTRRIAAGSYGIQMEKKFDDEIGDLTDAINNMSNRIKKNEQMKSEFISSVSHELRTPLTAVNGWAETILSGELTDPKDIHKGMEIIVSEARRLTKMVEELLEFSRIEDGRITLSMESIDLVAEFEDAVYTYREFYRKEGITLNYAPTEREFPLIPGDPQRLRQVFSNLLDNAAKHGGAGGRIDTAVGEEEGCIAVVIRDYGPGIPEEELPHVKEKFYKGSSKARGNGIGLAVCDEIVARHGGRLDIANAQDGGGCVVTVLLPMDTRTSVQETQVQ